MVSTLPESIWMVKLFRDCWPRKANERNDPIGRPSVDGSINTSVYSLVMVCTQSEYPGRLLGVWKRSEA